MTCAGRLHQRFTAEVGVIKACSLAPLKPLGEVLGRMKELEATACVRPGVPAQSVGGHGHRASNLLMSPRRRPHRRLRAGGGGGIMTTSGALS